MNLFLNQKILLLVINILGCVSFSFAQQKTVSYTIINRNDSVGNMQAVQKISGDDIVYNLSSLVEIRMLISIRVHLLEEAHYHKEKMVLSTSKRTVNEKLRGSKQTKATNEGYLITDDGEQSRLNQKSISYDFPRLYFKEPAGISQIYSDYYQKVLTIKIIKPHVYQINLPEGGSNTYYYENGVCQKADLHSTLFNAHMILFR